jgi:hypothetical protein
MAWTSTDSVRWARQPVPAGSTGYADLQRVVARGDGVVAVGLRGERLGVWFRERDRWHAGPAFGALDPQRRSAPFVSGLATVGGDVLVAASDGSHFGLWAGPVTRPLADVRVPDRPSATGDHQLTVAADGDAVLLLADDGTTSRVWLGAWPGRS